MSDLKFIDILQKELNKYLEEVYKDKEKNKILGQRIINHLIGDSKSEDSLPLLRINPRQIFLSKIFKNYLEISGSLENMKMIAIFIKQYPNYKIYKVVKVTKTKYLRYHIENYLHEIYLFEKRIEIFLNIITKKLKSHNLSKEMNVVNNLKKLTHGTLESIVKLRGRHVHENRFTNNKIDQLESLEFQLQEINVGVEFLKPYKELLYREHRSYWSKTINNNNQELQKMLDMIFDKLKPIIFKSLLPLHKE